MKKYLFILIVLPFLATACASSPYRSESKPVHFADGSVQVRLKFDDEEAAAEGREVTALNQECKTKYFRDRERLSCIRNLASIGKIVGIGPDKIATVEFKDGQAITEITQFEVLKSGGK